MADISYLEELYHKFISVIYSTINSQELLKQMTIKRKKNESSFEKEALTKYRNGVRRWIKMKTKCDQFIYKELHKTFMSYLFKGKRIHIRTMLDQKQKEIRQIV